MRTFRACLGRLENLVSECHPRASSKWPNLDRTMRGQRNLQRVSVGYQIIRGAKRVQEGKMRIGTVLRKFDWKGWLGWMAATMAGVQLVAVMIFLYFAVDLDNHWWGDPATVTVAG